MCVAFETKVENFQLKNQNLISKWITDVIHSHDKTPGDITYIFLSDEELLEYNKNYLQHDFYTDVITFDYTQENILSADIFISIDRIVDNSSAYNNSVSDELKRVMIHGVLHLLGYDDKNDEDMLVMRKQENIEMELLKEPIV